MTRVLMPGDRLWSPDGLTATVSGVDQRGLLAVVDGERLPVPVRLGGWRLALPCDRCQTPADLAVRTCDGDAALMCRGCAHAEASGPAAWSAPVPRTLIRELYVHCPWLG